MSTVGVGVIGFGDWGVNVARAFASARGATLRGICDLHPDRLALAAAAHPGVRLTRALDELLDDGTVEAVAVAVDSPRHHEVGRRALLAGRHVLVEKPMALSVADAAELWALARERRRVLMAGHVLLHHPAILRARELIAGGELGPLRYLNATRVAWGTVRANESAWWSVAPHDIAVALYLFDAVPATVSATGAAYLRPGLPDVAFATLAFDFERLAHLHVSWLAPAKHRALALVGRRRTLTFDEMAPPERSLRIVDGEQTEPLALPRVEPLLAECEHFVECIARGEEPRGGEAQAMGVMRVLEAGDRSMRAGGAPVEVR